MQGSHQLQFSLPMSPGGWRDKDWAALASYNAVFPCSSLMRYSFSLNSSTDVS